MDDKQALWKLIDLPLLQEIQDNCAKALGVAFVTVDYRGIPVTKYSGFTSYCMLGRKKEGFAELCEQCDAHGGLHAAITGQPYIYRCHADLVDFSVPIIINGSFVGALLGGQVRLSDDIERSLERIIPQNTNWRKDPDLDAAYQKAEKVPYAKLEAAVKVVRDMILHMVQTATEPTQPVEIEPSKPKQLDNRARILDIALQKKEVEGLRQQPGFRYFFFVMNMIAQIAREENAPLTENLAYDFAEVMRYNVDASHKASTLGEELGYINALLRIHKACMEQEIAYTISIPKGYWNVPCPFMVLQPIIEGILASGSHDQRGYHIDMVAEEDGGNLLFQIKTIGEKMTIDEIERKLTDTVEENHLSLYEADRNLKRMFGKRYYIQAEERTDGWDGMVISFNLPLG